MRIRCLLGVHDMEYVRDVDRFTLWDCKHCQKESVRFGGGGAQKPEAE